MRLSLIIFLFLGCSISYSQPYGNEWIDYSQSYYSFKIYQEGLFRIDYSSMQTAGVPLNTINSNQIQVFGRENEVPIYIQDGGDGTIDPGDYIEFYANKNDSWMDSLIYDQPDHVMDPYFSLYNDTINYFLTWITGSGQRVVEETDVNFTAFNAQPFYMKKEVVDFKTQYVEGVKQSGLSSSFFTEGEGWARTPVNAVPNSPMFFASMPTSNVYTGIGAPDAEGITVFTGVSNASYTGQGNHHMIVEYGSPNIQILDTVYLGYKLIKYPFQVSSNTLLNSSTSFRHRFIDDQGAASDYQSMCYVELNYPHTLDFEGQSFDIIQSPRNTLESKSRYDLSNHSITNPVVYSIGDQTRKIPAQINGGILQFLVPNNSIDPNKVIIADEAQIISISNLYPVNGTGQFTDYSSSNDNFLIITETSLLSGASQYESYRESAMGGAYNVLTADVNELYFQFGGGIEKHAIAIRRFTKFFLDNSTTSPEYLFIIGKGIREANESNTVNGQGSRMFSQVYQANLVPSWGYPSSDILLTAGFNGSIWTPLLATGRLSANVNQDVFDYLGKVQEFETEQDPNSPYSIASKDWQKQILHFGGGSTASEQQLFKSYLQNYENMIEGMDFAGNVFSTYKTTSDPIDPVASQEVTNKINQGTSIMTFFGHASSSGFDQNVDDPANWSNQGKYPLVIGNACYTGDIFQSSSNSTSERFVMLPDRGAIAFLSSVKLGFAQTLNQYTQQLYQNISSNMYGQNIGKQIQQTISSIENPSGTIPLESVCVGMTLHGDPALKVNWHQHPEFEINNQSVFVGPEDINLSVDSITVSVVLTNIGKATDSSFTVELRRSLPGATADSVYNQTVSGLYYKDSIQFKMPLDPNNGVGLNNFTVKVDIPTLVKEQYDEVFNNQITIPFLIQLDGIYPVWPYEYAVVPKDTIALKASTNNPFAASKLYRFEIDTTDLFNSPFRKFYEVNSEGGVVSVDFNEWTNADLNFTDPLILIDSTVYFWRVAFDSTVMTWNESSFQYIPGQTGWGQEHFFQFKNGVFSNIDYNRTLRKRSFFPDKKVINCQVFGNSLDNNELLATDWKIDGEVQDYAVCTLTPSLHVAVINPITLEPWGTANGGQNPQNSFGNANDGANCRNRVEKFFIFRQNDPVSLAAFENMVMNEIPDSFYVLIYTATYADYTSWDALYPNTYNVFQSLGSDSVVAGKPNVPFIFFAKKGDLTTANEVYGSNIDANLILYDTLVGYDYLGEEKSTLIGPAFEWGALYWNQKPEEIPTNDSTRLQLFGVNALGAEDLIFDTLFNQLDSIVNLDQIANANQYPWLRLNAILKDSIDFTPAQIDGWHVLYQPVPEAAIDGGLSYYWTASDTIQEGEEVSFGGIVKNISDYPMDSLLVSYWVEDQSKNIHPITYPRQDSLRVGAELFDTISFSTVGLPGNNLLWMEVNPYVTPFLTDQKEQYHFNNLAQIPFYVARDEINPILDVTFDGYHILNGDLVSGKAQIVISLNDENEYLLLENDSDTANFGIYLTDPLGVQRRIPFLNGSGQTIMQWIPADGPENKFKIIYDGEFSMDGTYELLVQGSDVSGNNSGDIEYRVEFEVINRSTITYLMNYPNPFSTSTRFVFTLTGNTVPDEMRIQIMTITGKLVKTVTMEEFGMIKVGHNISEYAWDGRDEWGDQLANGVYLYTVQIRIAGEQIEHRHSGADQYFKKEFGKMYLLR